MIFLGSMAQQAAQRMPHKDKVEYNAYMRKYMLRRYEERRDAARAILGGRCVKCGSTDALEFDHTEADCKSFTLTKGWSCSKQTFLKELAKCQLLCNSCHKQKTVEAGDPNGGGWNRVVVYDHGSGHMYFKDKCRCDRCREWRRHYRKKQVAYDGSNRGDAGNEVVSVRENTGGRRGDTHLQADGSKKCNSCGVTKYKTAYHKNRNRKDGLAGACKACWRKRNKAR